MGGLEMTRASAILFDLRHDGIKLETDGSRVRWWPSFMVSRPRQEVILAHKAELIKLLMTQGFGEDWRCKTCNRYLTSKGQCWTCCDRRCSCGRQTGSAFIELCQLCERN